MENEEIKKSVDEPTNQLSSEDISTAIKVFSVVI